MEHPVVDKTHTDYSFLSRYHYTKSKNYLKRRYRIRPWIAMFIGTPCGLYILNVILELPLLPLHFHDLKVNHFYHSKSENFFGKNNISFSDANKINIFILYYSFKSFSLPKFNKIWCSAVLQIILAHFLFSEAEFTPRYPWYPYL